ncbi:MAG: hypothetical protein QOG62_522 [Thermoleophilaceae bacterium]|jgi:hypothetical protein|nr:hypothetical protein [Thermoleophilaceae bacterium]
MVVADITVGAWLAILFFGSVLVFIILAWLHSPGSGAGDLLDYRPEEHAARRAELDAEDLFQMMGRENERRRAQGRREITEAELEMYGPEALRRP